MADQETSLSLDDVPIVTLNVGNPKTTFHVHRNLLCKASPVFNAAFLGSSLFFETKNQTMDLNDDDKDAFKSILQWLYTRKCGIVKPSPGENLCSYYQHLATVYATAEKYDMTDLKNNIIDLFLFRITAGLVQGPPNPDIVLDIYNTTPSKSPLRKLLADWYTWEVRMEWYGLEDTVDALSEIPEFAANLACSMGKRMGGVIRSSPLRATPHAYYEAKPKDTVTSYNGAEGTNEPHPRV